MKQKLILILSFFVSSLLVSAQTARFMPSERFSSSLISSLCQDQQGSIWIGTDYGLNRFDGYAFQTFLHDEADSTSLKSNTIVYLFCDNKGQVWVGTNQGLDRFDPATDSFVHYTFPNGYQPRVGYIIQRRNGQLVVGTGGYGTYVIHEDNMLKRMNLDEVGSYLSLLYEDTKGRLWAADFADNLYLYTDNKVEGFSMAAGNPRGFIEQDDEMLVVCQHGIMAYHDGKMTESDVDMSCVADKDIIFTEIARNSQGEIYIGTRGNGIYRLSSSRPRRLEPVDIRTSGIDLNTARVVSMMLDNRGNLWMGCQRKGLAMLPQRPESFSSWSFEGQGIRLGSTISSVCEGDNGITWCTVQGVGVYGFNRQGHVVAHPNAPEAVEFIFRDHQQRYWIGTDDGLFSYDPLTGHYQLKVTFDCDKFNDMTSDDDGNIYISTFSQGFCVYNPATGSLRNHNYFETDTVRGKLCNNWVMGMSTDHQGLLWMATSWGVACFDPKNDDFRSQGWESLLSGTMCFDVCELHSGELADGRQLANNIVIGTEEGLFLYDRKSRKVERFPSSEQLNNKVVSYIVQDNNGDIWCSTSDGIWQYSLRSHTFIGHVNGNGLTQREYIYGVGLHTDDDVIYFGQNDGLTVFSPNDIKQSVPQLDSLKLTAIRVGDQLVNSRTVINGVQVTKNAVSESNQFTLSYLAHPIQLAFSQFNFDNPMNMVLEYSINNGPWIRNPEGKNDFTLGHLQPGTYKIKVRAEQSGEYTPESEVTVTVKSPWYATTLAYIIYALIALAILALVALLWRRRMRERLDEDKMKFLINATHDIRSPLTLIMSPLDKMKRLLADNDSPELHESLNTIDHNAKRILNLVNQILDVRKIDKQQMHLHCQQTDLIDFSKGICKMFEYNAQERKIQFILEHDGLDKLDVWIDRNQFDKVITNLLSNAFKYNQDGGDVKLRLSATDSEAQLQVIDSGVGLEDDNLKHIFDRFYQGANTRRLKINGTGIGLNLCKMIVDMHHGTIDAHNRTDATGSVFTVRLPLGNSHLKPEEIDTSAPEPTTVSVGAPAPSSSSRHRVLIVDDDLEIGKYISTELGRYYKFSICTNGKEAMKELLTNEYDAVVSDVMMPEMDGFTMLRMIKSNLNLSHLPVVMLTSKADVANRLEGLERGADAFLAKPFVMEELHMVIENLIQSRLRLKGKFSGAQQQADKLEIIEVKGNDEVLMERIMKAINKNLSDSDFNVEMLSQEVGISRAQLHRKMKEMTGLSTSEFIRNIRLEQAARLLKEQKINVTQVAYTVGFSNLAHFSTIFRKQFGLAPSEYAEQE